MTTDKRGISALLLQRQLGLGRYETAWMMLHKLRRAMVNAAREPLHGEVEVDDTWIGGPQPGLRGSRQLKGRRAVPVLVAIERRGDRSGRVRLHVLSDFKAATMSALLQRHVAPGTTVYTDGLGAFSGLQAAGFDHVPLKQPERAAFRTGARSVVPLADRAIGNLQQWLIGTYHGVSRAQLQPYLDEFVFGTIVASNRWRPSRPCSAWAPLVPRRPTGASAAGAICSSRSRSPDRNMWGSPETTG
jgi:transposase-like protein